MITKTISPIEKFSKIIQNISENQKYKHFCLKKYSYELDDVLTHDASPSKTIIKTKTLNNP